MAQRILRPLGYGELLDELFDLYKKNFVLLIGIFGIVQVPIVVLSAFGMLPWVRFMEKMSTGAPPADPMAVFAPMVEMLIYILPLSLVGMVLGMVAMGATTWAVSSCYLGVKPTIMQSYKAIMPRVLPLIGVTLLIYLLSLAGVLACCVGVIAVTILTALASEVVILEGTGSVDALRRSYQLTAPNWVRVFVVGLILLILMSVVQSLITAPIQVFAMFSRNSMSIVYLLSTLLGGVARILTMPIWIITYVLLYYDIRVRSEGFDIEMLAAGMGVSPTAQPANPEQS